MGALKEPVLNLYETDFAAWALAQAKALERKEWGALDVANLVEELESMGKQQRAELVNRLKVLRMHLAKRQYQPTQRARRGNSWRGSSLRATDQHPHGCCAA
jgi:tRNA A37 N6-isopentenylltransferase MiaA